MAIPAFDHNHVLPPHTGHPATPSDLSPYGCSILEFCQHFSTTPERIKLLKSLVAFRIIMFNLGITNCFQWIDGSFTENIEVSEKRSPNDIDVITFYQNLDINQQKDIFNQFPDFFDSTVAKRNYLLDHYPVDLTLPPEKIVEYTRYWIQLFCHNRNKVWKGMIKLFGPDIDRENEALTFLDSL